MPAGIDTTLDRKYAVRYVGLENPTEKHEIIYAEKRKLLTIEILREGECFQRPISES